MDRGSGRGGGLMRARAWCLMRSWVHFHQAGGVHRGNGRRERDRFADGIAVDDGAVGVGGVLGFVLTASCEQANEQARTEQSGQDGGDEVGEHGYRLSLLVKGRRAIRVLERGAGGLEAWPRQKAAAATIPKARLSMAWAADGGH
ncbi:MAG: hypothetical protein AAGB19_12690 [Cyanobacteria bacterium P01_F01_bin.3]